MKKFLLSLVLFISLSFVNIEATPVNTFNVIPPKMELLNDSIDLYRPIYRYLDLKIDQKPMFNQIHNDLYCSIENLAKYKELASKDFKMHLNHDLHLSQMVLEKEQYHKYLRVLNVTLQNKDLIKYVED